MGHVTFSPQGRMGNFLFEFATAYAYAKQVGMPLSVPASTTSDFHCPIYCRHLIDPTYDHSLQTIQVVERQHNYMPIPFNEAWRDKNILLTGYYQTEKYFKEYREEILKAIDYKWVPEIGTVSLHVRRGDYVTFREKHPEVTEEFYRNAIAYFTSRGLDTFKVFSDDIPWCKEYFTKQKFGPVDFVFSEGQSIEEDMRLGSCCLHHINSSSTYSWWMAWLNRNANKIVITPTLWFTEGWDNCNVSDIIPESWIKM